MASLGGDQLGERGQGPRWVRQELQDCSKESKEDTKAGQKGQEGEEITSMGPSEAGMPVHTAMGNYGAE